MRDMQERPDESPQLKLQSYRGNLAAILYLHCDPQPGVYATSPTLSNQRSADRT